MSLLFDLFVIGPILLIADKLNEMNSMLETRNKTQTTNMECLAFDALQRQSHPSNYKYEEPDVEGLMNDNGPDW